VINLPQYSSPGPPCAGYTPPGTSGNEFYLTIIAMENGLSEEISLKILLLRHSREGITNTSKLKVRRFPGISAYYTV
jgi:hypothetical protein